MKNGLMKQADNVGSKENRDLNRNDLVIMVEQLGRVRFIGHSKIYTKYKTSIKPGLNRYKTSIKLW